MTRGFARGFTGAKDGPKVEAALDDERLRCSPTTMTRHDDDVFINHPSPRDDGLLPNGGQACPVPPSARSRSR
jgi:hypothetical protein